MYSDLETTEEIISDIRLMYENTITFLSLVELVMALSFEGVVIGLFEKLLTNNFLICG